MVTKIGVVGYQGNLGGEFSKLNKNNLEINPILIDRESLKIKNYNKKHDVIINCASKTNVEKCEIEVIDTYKSNVSLPIILLEAFPPEKHRHIFISSTGVYGNFDLEKQNFEDDICTPSTIHHTTKYIAEEAYVSSCENSTIVRTGWLFGGDNQTKDFIFKIVKELKNKTSVTSNEDQIGCPTYVKQLVQYILALIDKKECGVYNICNKGQASRYEYIKKINEILKLGKDIIPCSKAAFSRLANVPDNETGNCEKYEKVVDIEIQRWDQALKQLFHDRNYLN